MTEPPTEFALRWVRTNEARITRVRSILCGVDQERCPGLMRVGEALIRLVQLDLVRAREQLR